MHRGILALALFVTLPLWTFSDRVFGCGFPVYEDGSCRTVCFSTCDDGRACMWRQFVYSCPDGGDDCIAATLPPPPPPWCEVCSAERAPSPGALDPEI